MTERPLAPQTADEVRRSVIAYCEMSAGWAEENPLNPLAVGLARAYRDVAEKLRPALERASGE